MDMAPGGETEGQKLSLVERFRRPGSSPFKQQRLPAWQPIMTAKSVLPFFYIVAVFFIPVGIGLFFTTNGVQEHEVKYSTDCFMDSTPDTTCDTFLADTENRGKTCLCSVDFTLEKDFKTPVYIYYGLTNFYQNHRLYVKSRDDEQLTGKNLGTLPSTDCEPFRTEGDKTIVPAGTVANTMFNDSFVLERVESGIDSTVVEIQRNMITWTSDREHKFGNPSGNYSATLRDKYAKPPSWNQSIGDMPDGLKNEEFIVWMRLAAYPDFRKFYGRINVQGDSLPKGDYTLKVDFNYPVKSFNGEKYFVISTTSWLGGRNNFLGIAYIVVGCISLVTGLVFTLIHFKFRRRSENALLQDHLNDNRTPYGTST